MPLIVKPMLAGKFDPKLQKFPVFGSPKLDGVRCLMMNGKLMSRSLKPIPNEYTQELFSGDSFIEGMDGELIVGDPTAKDCYTKTVSGVMRQAGEPDVYYYVFDSWLNPQVSFRERLSYEIVIHSRYNDRMKVMNPSYWNILDLKHLLEIESMLLSEGYEGLILRDPEGVYKFGRSTTKEGGMIKVKRFEDSEARIIGMEELMHNLNEAKQDNLGHTERSSHQENLVPAGTLGALIVEDIKTGQRFNIGTGFSQKVRDELWGHPIGVLGKLVKYKYFPVGVKDLPRHPVYLGFRDERDL